MFPTQVLNAVTLRLVTCKYDQRIPSALYGGISPRSVGFSSVFESFLSVYELAKSPAELLRGRDQDPGFEDEGESGDGGVQIRTSLFAPTFRPEARIDSQVSSLSGTP